jgi:hypothetical protein
MQATKLPLTTRFQAFYLIGQAKTGIEIVWLSWTAPIVNL